MLNYMVFLLISALVVGCTSTAGKEFAVADASRIKIGDSKSDVQSVMGAPYNTRTDYTGDEVWMWNYNSVTQAGYLTIMGLAGSKSDSSQLNVTFHGGLVSSCVVSIEHHEGSGMSGMVGGGSGSSTRTNCSDLQQRPASAS